MVISNAEKQARFRRKEELKKFAEKTFREWQGMVAYSDASPSDVLALLNEAANLPARWTSEDYERAERRIGQLRVDLISSKNDLQNDVHEARNMAEEFVLAPDAEKFIADVNETVTDTRALASHLISAIQLSRHTRTDIAAAVMEVMRHVGRIAASSPGVAKCSSNAVCLASLPAYYDRPNWFVEMLARWLVRNLGKDLAKELGHHLVKS